MRLMPALSAVLAVVVSSHALGGGCEPRWTALCTGVSEGGGNSSVVSDFLVFDDGTGEALYVAGRFRFAGGVTVNNIARWDGAAWSAVGDGLGPANRIVTDLEIFDDGTGPALYACGDFRSPNGVALNGVAKWNGSEWLPLAGAGGVGFGPSTADCYALAVFDDGSGPALYVGGNFETAGGASAFDIAKWDGTAWSGIGGTNQGGVFALRVFDDGRGPALFVGGQFTTAGGDPHSRIARWDGTSWSGVGGGVRGGASPFSVDALEVYDDGTGPALFAAGNFSVAGAVSNVGRIAKWDGQSWSALTGPTGTGLDWFARYLLPTDEGLLVAGQFERAGGVDVNGVARWDGSAWSPAAGTGVSGGTIPRVLALGFFDAGRGDELYIGGEFFGVDGNAATRVARFGCPVINPACPGDINGDCSIGFADLNAVLSAFGDTGTPGALFGDTNADGIVNFTDLNAALAGFGTPCP